MRLFAAALALCATGFAVSAASTNQRVADAVITGEGFPRTLAEYGFFKDANGWQPSDRVVPYKLNTPLFTDYADKYRFIYVPPGQKVDTDGEGLLRFPVGSALIKSFGYEIAGEPRLIETRVLLHRADGWLALPYVWNEEQTEAKLKVAGKRLPVTFTDPSGTERTISYAVPNKNQCKECHSLSGTVTPIGPKARNLDDGMQLERMTQLGLIAKVPEIKKPLPVWDGPQAASLDDRARGYLDANCAHCHNRKGSASNSGMFLTWEEDNPVHVGVGKRPTAAGRGSGGMEFAIAPGQPDQSFMIYRLKSLDPGIAMPEVGRSTVHDEGVELLSAWIAEME